MLNHLFLHTACIRIPFYLNTPIPAWKYALPTAYAHIRDYGECILPCRDGAIKIKWDADTSSMQEKMVEHVYAALQKKSGKYIFISFLTQISPACDCYRSEERRVGKECRSRWSP